MAGYGARLGEENPRNWLEHRVGKHYMALRTAFAFITVAVGVLCFLGALTLAYLHLGDIPRRASILVIAAGVLGVVGIRAAAVVIAHTAGRRWPAIIAVVLNAVMVLTVIVMYIAGAVLG
ncbi:MAG: hypothetical protein II772_07265 [Lachnospiraceae bacterium]|nr:hypothetical protein [Lachnospiraceae bacterium]